VSDRLVFTYRLHDGVSPEQYEAWLSSRDVPFTTSMQSVLAYEVVRVDGPLAEVDHTGILPSYVEMLEITSLDEYTAEFHGKAADELSEEWGELVSPDRTICSGSSLVSFRRT
jgi:hypothetical protein